MTMGKRPNATLRAIRIYASESRWGKDLRWVPDNQPFEVRNFPKPGCVATVFLGEVPAVIREQIHQRKALANAMAAMFIGEGDTLDQAVEAELETVPIPAYDDHDWYVVLMFDRPAYVPEGPTSNPERAWWDYQGAESIDNAFRNEAKQVLDVLTAHASGVIGQEFFEIRVTESDLVVVLSEDRPLTFIPKFTGTASASITKGIENFPAHDLGVRIRSLTTRSWNEHAWLRRAVEWYVVSLSTTNRWRLFQASWLALEMLTHKLAAKYKDEVLNQLAFPLHTSPSEAIQELAWSKERAPLTAKFAVVALTLAPEDAIKDLQDFKVVKDARDALSHGSISDPDELPIAQLQQLVRKYIDVALQRLLP
jgi:hypothetical protein